MLGKGCGGDQEFVPPVSGQCQSLTLIRISGILESETLEEVIPMSLNVSLTPELEEYIASKVESGNYNSASEVVREGLRLLQAAEEAKLRWAAEAREKIERGWQQAQEGKLVDGDVVFQRINAKSEARRKKRA